MSVLVIWVLVYIAQVKTEVDMGILNGSVKPSLLNCDVYILLRSSAVCDSCVLCICRYVLSISTTATGQSRMSLS